MDTNKKWRINLKRTRDGFKKTGQRLQKTREKVEKGREKMNEKLNKMVDTVQNALKVPEDVKYSKLSLECRVGGCEVPDKALDGFYFSYI